MRWSWAGGVRWPGMGGVKGPGVGGTQRTVIEISLIF